MPALYAQCEAGIPLTEEQIRAAISLYRRCGVQIVNLYYGLCTQERIALLRENGILTSVWTVNDASCARQFLDAGVYNITTRQPVMVLRTAKGNRRMNQTSSRRILLLAPHQDDECLQTAGIIYQAAHSGAHVACASLQTVNTLPRQMPQSELRKAEVYWPL